jgi:hypothetical protein
MVRRSTVHLLSKIRALIQCDHANPRAGEIEFEFAELCKLFGELSKPVAVTCGAYQSLNQQSQNQIGQIVT